VGLLLDLKNYIPWLDSWSLIAFSAEFDFVTALHPTIYMDMQDFPLNDRLLTVTLFAFILLANYLSFTVAIRANGLKSLNHGTHLPHHGLHAVSITTGTLLDGTFFATSALAFWADDRLL
jgi:hypothetical protein